MRVAWESSPDAAVAGWKSPVRNFRSTVTTTATCPFSKRWTSPAASNVQGLPYEELVIPNGLHETFLRSRNLATHR